MEQLTLIIVFVLAAFCFFAAAFWFGFIMGKQAGKVEEIRKTADEAMRKAAEAMVQAHNDWERMQKIGKDMPPRRTGTMTPVDTLPIPANMQPDPGEVPPVNRIANQNGSSVMKYKSPAQLKKIREEQINQEFLEDIKKRKPDGGSFVV